MRLFVALLTSFVLLSIPLLGQNAQYKDPISIQSFTEYKSDLLANTQEIAFLVVKGDSTVLAYISDKKKMLLAINTLIKLDQNSGIGESENDQGLMLIKNKQITHKYQYNLFAKFLSTDSILIVSNIAKAVIAIDGIAIASGWSEIFVRENEYAKTIDEIIQSDKYLMYFEQKTAHYSANLNYVDSSGTIMQIQADSFWLDIALTQAKGYYDSEVEYENALNDIGEVGLILSVKLNKGYREFKVISWDEVADDQYKVEVEYNGKFKRNNDSFTIDTIATSNEYLINLIKKD